MRYILQADEQVCLTSMRFARSMSSSHSLVVTNHDGSRITRFDVLRHRHRAIPRIRFALLVAWLSALAVGLPRVAQADELGAPIELSSWAFTWGGYVHVAYRWIQEPQNYNLVGRNNGFQLEQARLAANVQWKDKLAVRLSFEGASEDRLSQSFPGGQITARLRDAYTTWAPLRFVRVTVGQMVTPWDLDSMRSDAEMPFVDRAVPVEGVQPSEGRTTLGMGADRNLGISIHSGDIDVGANMSLRYSVFLGNGNGQNQLLNDNNLPAVFGRVEYAFWGDQGLPEDRIGPMRAYVDLKRKPIVSVGVAGQYNPRTAGNLPNLVNETDAGTAADVMVSILGIDCQAGILYLKTIYNTLSSVPDLERFGWWAHLRYTIPKLPFDLTPGYRIANYQPRAHIETSGGSSADQTMDGDLALLYHTFGISVRPNIAMLPIHANVNYTITSEKGPNRLNNDRFDVDLVVPF